MAYLRHKALDQLSRRKKITVELPSTKVSDFFGEKVYTLEEMRATLAPEVYKKVSKATFLSSGANNEGKVVLEILIR